MAFLNELCIEEYRGIKRLRIEKLRQVNLIVGDNNCGKTSVLEAVELLRTSGNLANVYRIARQRDSLAMKASNSLFDSFLCMFPANHSGTLSMSVSGICNGEDISFHIQGRKERILLEAKDISSRIYRLHGLSNEEIEADEFEGTISLQYGNDNKRSEIHVNQYSSVTGVPSSDKDLFSIIYVSPFEHLRGSVISRIIRNESYKKICIKALQLFDPDIEDMMIFRSDTGNRPVEYLRHKKLGDMPVSSYGDGIKKVLALSNAIAMAVDGILLIDEIETAIHKKYYDDIFRFLVKACSLFNVQAFITTHSIEAIDGLLATQDYELQTESDDICVCTVKKIADGTVSRVLSGREVYENREAFGFEVRL